jgi:hypothetical protein
MLHERLAAVPRQDRLARGRCGGSSRVRDLNALLEERERRVTAPWQAGDLAHG